MMLTPQSTSLCELFDVLWPNNPDTVWRRIILEPTTIVKSPYCKGFHCRTISAISLTLFKKPLNHFFVLNIWWYFFVKFVKGALTSVTTK